MVQSHQRSSSISESEQDLKDSPDDTQDFTNMEQTYEATIQSQKDRRSRDLEDLERQGNSTRIYLKCDLDVRSEPKQDEGTIIT